MIITLLIFIVILMALILSHEAGHFFSARFFGVKVEEFGFGLPPRAFGWQGKKTLYSLNYLPFGGFVRIFGEEGEGASEAGSFSGKPAGKRALILAAGILANILLAYFAFTALAVAGIPEILTDDEVPGTRVSLVEVAPGSPADKAGFSPGDKVKKIASEKEEIAPLKISEITGFISKNLGGSLKFSIERNGESLEKTVSPRVNPPEGEGPMGVSLGFLASRKIPFYQAPLEGAFITWQAFKLTVFGFYDIIVSLFKGEGERVQVAGPVGMFGLISSARSSGFASLLMFLGILSVNLAIINLLPIPGLDGGRLFFLLIELVKGTRISPRTSNLFHTAGLIILIALMLLVTYHDIIKLF